MQSAFDQQWAVNDGITNIGLIRPRGRAFEVFRSVGDQYVYVGKVDSRGEAIALLRDAHQSAAMRPTKRQERRR